MCEIPNQKLPNQKPTILVPLYNKSVLVMELEKVLILPNVDRQNYGVPMASLETKSGPCSWKFLNTVIEILQGCVHGA